MTAPARFPYLPKGTGGTLVPDLAPILPIELFRNNVALRLDMLVDSGADISVLPWSVGLRFGVSWDMLNVPGSVRAAGGGVSGKVISLKGRVANFTPVDLPFLWIQSDQVRPILGQFNFFQEFDVCFFGAKQEFHVQPRTP